MSYNFVYFQEVGVHGSRHVPPQAAWTVNPLWNLGGEGLHPLVYFFKISRMTWWISMKTGANALNLVKRILKSKVNHIGFYARVIWIYVCMYRIYRSVVMDKNNDQTVSAGLDILMLRLSLIIPRDERRWLMTSIFIFAGVIKFGFWSENCTPVTWPGRRYDQLS